MIAGAVGKGLLGSNPRRPKTVLPNEAAYRNQLQTQANGLGPSAVQRQAEASTEQAQAQALSLAASARGNNIGQAQRQAQVSAAGATQGIAADAGVARIQEQEAAKAAFSEYIWNENAARQEAERRKQADAEQRAANRRALIGGIFQGVGAFGNAAGGLLAKGGS
jgi:hypothetical protein